MALALNDLKRVDMPLNKETKPKPSVFWDVEGILLIDYLEKRRTSNNEYYISLLVRLKEEIANKETATNDEEKSVLSQDNAPCHSQRLPNYMDCTSKCFRSHPIL